MPITKKLTLYLFIFQKQEGHRWNGIPRRYSESLFSKTSLTIIFYQKTVTKQSITTFILYQLIEKYQKELDIDICDENMKIISIVRNPYEKVLYDLFWFKNK